MKIGIIGFIDDNFGDMILRNCFTQLLRVAFKNLDINIDECDFSVISVSQPDETLAAQMDLLCFPGGAMFGRTPQAFAEPIEKIVDIAEQRHIPVIFSSIGMLETEENEAALTRILNKECVRAFSVREKEDVFRQYAANADTGITKVCDPAVWTEKIYRPEIKKGKNEKPVVGINAVRGGLFSTYGGKWKLADEEAYLYSLSQALDTAGIDYRFFANGQTLDCNVLLHFADKYGVSSDKLLCPDTSAELVQTIAGFDAVAAVRMHSSILSYSLGIPSINVVWNSKIRDFYQDIDHPERIVEPDDSAAENAANLIGAILKDESCAPDTKQMMTLYRFLFEALQGVCNCRAEMFDYEQVCAALQSMPLDREENERDLRIKIRRGEVRYASLFRSDLTQKAKVRKLTRDVKNEKANSASLSKELESKTLELRQIEEKLSDAEKQLTETKNRLDSNQEKLNETQNQLDMKQEELSKTQNELRIKQRELDYLNSRFIVKVYRDLAKKGQVFRKKGS